MAHTNLKSVYPSKQKKKNHIKHLWTERFYNADKNIPQIIFHYAESKPLKLDKPIPNLKTISLSKPSECDVVTGLLPPKPTLVNLIAGNSLHIPSIKTKVSCTNSPKNPTAIIATNRVQESSDKMAKKKGKAKRLAAMIAAQNAKQVGAAQAIQTAVQTVAQAAVQGVAPATIYSVGQAVAQATTQVATQGVAQTATQAAAQVLPNPANTNQQISGPDALKTFTNQQKKKWFKFQQKLFMRKKSVNLKWEKPNATPVDEPVICEEPPLPETSQDGSPSVIGQARQSPTAVSTDGANKGSNTFTAVPILQKPSITLKTKKSLQQEMVKQRLNCIKPDANAAGNVPGPSTAPQSVYQSVSPKDSPQIVEIPQAPLSGGSTIPILENRAVESTPRSNAGSFFKKVALPSQPSPSPRAPNVPMAEIYTYRYPKGIPRSFLFQQEVSSGSPMPADSPIWPTTPNMNAYQMNAPTLVQPPPVNMGDCNMNPATSPTFVQTENPHDVQQPYSPSDVYSEQGTNPEPPEVDSESSEQNQAGQKRLSAFQRLGPISQPKKPKLTINLNLKKEQPVREVVNETDDDPDKYTPVHLRKDIMMSADETVLKFLPSWPWRKNIVVRRTATARNSRSVMILEQEKMEEVYEKDNIFVQISVKGYPSTWTKERVLDAVLDSVRGYSLIPCFTEFYQHECKFLVLRSRSALIVLHKTGFYIHKDGVELTIAISLPVLPDKVDFIPRIILRKRIIMGYMDNKLNLSAFTLQEDISHFIYFPLNRLNHQSECALLQSAINWDRLVELNLSHNRLTNISGFDLLNLTPSLKHLNLSHNYLEKITILLSYRQLPLKTIHLEGNPLCHDYIDPEHYVTVIRMMFPGIVEIDGVPIQPKGKLPNHKQNYCPEDAQEVSEKFLEIFFPLLDSGPDHRSLIQGMYEDDASLTITYCYKLRYGQKYRNFRNLFLYARFLDEGETDSVVGAMAITKLINRWPHTEHDPFTFTVDALYHTEHTTILRISGVLKLTAETLAEDEHLLSFTRTVVLHSEDGTEYKIHNEMVYWDEPTAAAARSAFRVNTISQKNFNLKIESTTDEDLRDKFLKIFMKLTSMDKKICERCLEINNWNFKLALEHFTKLLKLNNLESLTQEIQVVS